MSISITVPKIPGFTPEWTFNAAQLLIDPEFPQTEALCLEAVTKNGALLEMCEIQTPEICLAAVKDYGKALQYCNHFSQEICDAAVDNDAKAIRYVPNIYQTEALCLKVVECDGYLLQYCKRQTPKVVQTALEQDPDALVWVRNQTPDMVKVLLASTEDPDLVMQDVHYTMLAKQPRPQKVFTQEQVTNMILGLNVDSAIKNDLLKQIL